MSVRLRDLIRAVRACKTAAEERSVIAKESAALRNAFRDQDTLYRHRNVAKLMFIHMLGYPTHFGQMETLKLIAANGFPEKRIGYLGLMILLDERHEVLMLVTNSLKNDLNSRNQYSVGLALCALGNICSVEMARDLSPELEKLLSSNNSFIRKKAALCCTRVLRKVPEAIEGFQERAAGLLKDRHHGVLLTGVTLMLELCSIEPALIPVYQEQVPLLCKILRSLLMSGFMPDHDVGGITDPFLQVKILQLLQVLGHGNSEVSDQMSDILAQVATNTEATRNAGNAILYEAVQTIMGTESIGGLRVLAINILGRFLANRDNNIRYVALNTLAKVVSVDTQAVQRHRNTIVDCVKDADVSIRRRALDLVYALVNEGNIKQLTKELLDYLKISDAEFKPDLTSKICQLVQRYAPDKRWHFDSTLQVLVQAGAYAKEEVCRTLVVLVSNEAPLHGYAARQSFRALQKSQNEASLLLQTTATWFLGEYGDQLVRGGGQVLAGEERLSVTSEGLVNLLASILVQPTVHPIAAEYALTALMKLSSRLPDQATRIKALVAKHTGSSDLEIQSRSCEYGRLFQFDSIRPQLLEPMPALDEATYMARFSAPSVVASGPALTVPAENANGKLTSDLGDLLTLDDDLAPATASHPATSSTNYLQDLLGDGLSAPPPAATSSAAAPDLLDLLGGATSAPAPAQDLLGSAQAAPSASSRPAADPFADLTGPSSSSAPAGWPTTKVFEKDGIVVGFDFSKPSGRPPTTDITATYTNTGPSQVTDFTLQAAVPKFMQLKLDPASGTALPVGSSPVTQKLHVNNSQHGVKPLVLRLRLAYSVNGSAKVEQVEVKNLPAGL